MFSWLDGFCHTRARPPPPPSVRSAQSTAQYQLPSRPNQQQFRCPFLNKIRSKITALESVFHGASWRRDPCCLYSIEPAEAAASIHATASAPTPLLGEVGLRAAQAVTRERPASCDAREAARAGEGGGERKTRPFARFLLPSRAHFPFQNVPICYHFRQHHTTSSPGGGLETRK